LKSIKGKKRREEKGKYAGELRENDMYAVCSKEAKSSDGFYLTRVRR